MEQVEYFLHKQEGTVGFVRENRKRLSNTRVIYKGNRSSSHISHQGKLLSVHCILPA